MAACIAAMPAVVESQATTASAPAQQGTATSAPATTDKQPGPSSFLFRVGGFMQNGQRNYAFNSTVNGGTGSLKGVEVLLRGGGVGLSVRSQTGTFTTSTYCDPTGCNPSSGTQPDVTSADASLLLGPRAFTVFLGASKRALTDVDLNVTQVYTFARVGAQMNFVIGGSGLSAQIGGWGYVPADQETMKIGGEGEGSIIYTPPKLPIYLQLGYRTEVFTSKTTTTQTPEEVRGLRLGGGIQFGGK
jgi:hypothetical protein